MGTRYTTVKFEIILISDSNSHQLTIEVFAPISDHCQENHQSSSSIPITSYFQRLNQWIPTVDTDEED
jgi:hypothetical protein